MIDPILSYADLLAELERAQKRLDEIAGHCRRHAHAGCVTSTHALAAKVLQIAEGRKEAGEGVRRG